MFETAFSRAFIGGQIQDQPLPADDARLHNSSPHYILELCLNPTIRNRS
jgi:hypothetical protein